MTFKIETRNARFRAGIHQVGVLHQGGFRCVFFCKRAGILALAHLCEGGWLDSVEQPRLESLINLSTLPNAGEDIDPDNAEQLDTLFKVGGNAM